MSKRIRIHIYIYNDKCETEQDLDVRNKGTQHVRNMDELLYKRNVPVRRRGKEDVHSPVMSPKTLLGGSSSRVAFWGLK